MEALSDHSFKIDLEAEDTLKPLPYVKRTKSKNPHNKITLTDYYPKHEEEFYEMVGTCAKYIDKIRETDVRLKYHKELSRIFVIRHRESVMRLFRELVNLAYKGR